MFKNNNSIHDENSLEEYLHLFDYLRVPAIQTKDMAWNTLLFSINKKIKTSRTRILVYRTLAVAAGIAMFFGIFQWFGNQEVEKTSHPGQMITLYLPDSSQVTMNAVSTIHFRTKNWNQHRIVHLEGEAFFKVKKGSRFEVITLNGKVAVLGTTFNVFARGNQLKVYCKTGKVAVSAGNTILLTPGLKTQVIKGNPMKMEWVSEDHESSWLAGEFWFRNAPLSDVVAEIERQYNVIIRVQTDDQRFYTGYFNHQSLEKTLTSVFGPMQLKYIVTHNQTIHR